MYSVVANNIPQMEALIKMEQSGFYDFWTRVGFNSATDIMVAPDQVEEFLSCLSQFDIEHHNKISDVQE